MEIIPAIDLKGGRCVRLFQGDFRRETVFSDDPLAVAQGWQEQGGARLHLVDLDGAAAGAPAHLEIIAAIVGALDIPVQVGGGIRTRATAAAWLDAGVDRVVLGTAAVTHPELVRQLCGDYGPARVVAALDARGGMVAVRGWTEPGGVGALELAAQLAELGLERLLYTDIDRDGMLSGPDLATNARLVQQTGLAVLASGGVATLAHLRELRQTGVEGVVVGRALYTGAINLAEAVAAVQ